MRLITMVTTVQGANQGIMIAIPKYLIIEDESCPYGAGAYDKGAIREECDGASS